jgi:hypothetical protein
MSYSDDMTYYGYDMVYSDNMSYYGYDIVNINSYRSVNIYLAILIGLYVFYKIMKLIKSRVIKWQQLETDKFTRWQQLETDKFTRWQEVETSKFARWQEVETDKFARWQEVETDKFARWQEVETSKFAKNETPNIQDETPNIQNETPNVQNETPKIQNETSKIQNKTSNVQKPIPKPRRKRTEPAEFVDIFLHKDGIPFIEYYSDKSFKLCGNTRPHKDKIKDIGGRYNPNLTGGSGWIFKNNEKGKVNKWISEEFKIN